MLIAKIFNASCICAVVQKLQSKGVLWGTVIINLLVHPEEDGEEEEEGEEEDDKNKNEKEKKKVCRL